MCLCLLMAGGLRCIPFNPCADVKDQGGLPGGREAAVCGGGWLGLHLPPPAGAGETADLQEKGRPALASEYEAPAAELYQHELDFRKVGFVNSRTITCWGDCSTDSGCTSEAGFVHISHTSICWRDCFSACICRGITSSPCDRKRFARNSSRHEVCSKLGLCDSWTTSGADLGSTHTSYNCRRL